MDIIRDLTVNLKLVQKEKRIKKIHKKERKKKKKVKVNPVILGSELSWKQKCKREINKENKREKEIGK